MAKTAGLVAAALAYVIVSCLFVGGLGRAHRESLAGRARDSVAPEPASRPDPARRPTGALAIERPIDAPKLPAEVSEPVRPAPSAAPLSPKPPLVAVSTPAPRPAEAGVALGSPSPQPQGLELIDPFFGSPAATKKWDLSRLTTSQELDLGRQLNKMVLLPRLNRSVEDGPMERRLLEAAGPILANRARKDVEYKFFILDSDEVNAFSHPGGYIYVTRGLMDWIGEDEGYVLQFALAHEICHVDRGDAVRCLRDPEVMKLPFGTLQSFYLLIFPLGYSKSLELEADVWALRQLQQLQHSRHECLAFMRKLNQYAEINNFLQGEKPPESGRMASLFENHYRAHPGALNRLNSLKAIVYDSPKASK